MNKEFWLEAFGYLGTVLVIISMMMTSMLKFRIINISGGFISTIYAILRSTWPVAIMNMCLIVINTYHVIRELRQKNKYDRVVLKTDDESLKFFINTNLEDIKKYFPSFDGNLREELTVYAIYDGSCMAGIFAFERFGSETVSYIDYTTTKYRDYKVAKYLFPTLKDDGVCTITESAGVEAHDKYLVKMGFEKSGDKMVKKL